MLAPHRQHSLVYFLDSHVQLHATSPPSDAMKLSVIIITKNESHNIAACIESVGFVDEIIVVDSGSSDATVELAYAAGARVIETVDWPGFGIQKGAYR